MYVCVCVCAFLCVSAGFHLGGAGGGGHWPPLGNWLESSHQPYTYICNVEQKSVKIGSFAHI